MPAPLPPTRLRRLIVAPAGIALLAGALTLAIALPQEQTVAAPVQPDTRADLAAAATRAPVTCAKDAVTNRAVMELLAFRDWLRVNKVSGVVGEVGWPATPEWNTLAATVLAQARAAGLPEFAYAAAPWWPADHPLAFYRQQEPGQPATVDSAGAQAVVFEKAFPVGGGSLNLAEGSFGFAATRESSLSTLHPGRLNTDYTYPTAGTFRFLRSRGIVRARLAVMWERIQPGIGQPLRDDEVELLRASLDAAAQEGVQVILNLHNFGRFSTEDPVRGRVVRVLGSPDLRATDLADVWVRLATALKGSPALVGYDLMNEPHDLPGGATTWQNASRLVAQRLRAVDAKTAIYVNGYNWSGIGSWAKTHPRAWLSGIPNVVYEAHQYFDADRSGEYMTSYAEANRRIMASGWRSCGPPARPPAKPGTSISSDRPGASRTVPAAAGWPVTPAATGSL